jgi:hypothetical protein
MTSRFSQVVIIVLLFIGLLARSRLLLLLDVLLLIVSGSSWLWGRYCPTSVAPLQRAPVLGEEADRDRGGQCQAAAAALLKAEDEFPKEPPVLHAKLDYSAKDQRAFCQHLNLRWYERVLRHYRVLAERRGVFDFGRR